MTNGGSYGETGGNGLGTEKMIPWLFRNLVWRTSSTSDSAACVEVAWHKADASSPSGNCVEAGAGECGLIHVRDSKLGDASPVLNFTRAEWAAFLDGVGKGEFNLG